MTITLPAGVQKRFDVLVSLGDRDGGQLGSARAVYELLHGLCVEVYRDRLPSGDAPPQDDDSDRYHSLADAVRAAMHDFEDEYSHGPLVAAWGGMGRTSRTMASQQIANRAMGHLDDGVRVRVEAAFDGERVHGGDAPPDTTLENDDERSLWVLGAVDMDEDQADRLVRSYRARLHGGDAPQDHGPADVVRAMVREHGRTQVEEWARGVHPPRDAPQEPSFDGDVWDEHVDSFAVKMREASRPPGGAEPGLREAVEALARDIDVPSPGAVISRAEVASRLYALTASEGADPPSEPDTEPNPLIQARGYAPLQPDGENALTGIRVKDPEPSQTPDAPGWWPAEVRVWRGRSEGQLTTQIGPVSDPAKRDGLDFRWGGRCTRGDVDPVTEADLAKVAAELVHQWNLDGREHAGNTAWARRLVLRDLSPLLGGTRGSGDAATDGYARMMNAINKAVGGPATSDIDSLVGNLAVITQGHRRMVEARGRGAKAPAKRPTCLAEVEAWSPSSDRTMLTLQLDNSDRRQLLAWGGAQDPDDGLRERIAALGERLERAELRAARKAEDCTSSAVEYARHRSREHAMADGTQWLRAARGGGS